MGLRLEMVDMIVAYHADCDEGVEYSTCRPLQNKKKGIAGSDCLNAASSSGSSPEQSYESGSFVMHNRRFNADGTHKRAYFYCNLYESSPMSPVLEHSKTGYIRLIC